MSRKYTCRVAKIAANPEAKAAMSSKKIGAVMNVLKFHGFPASTWKTRYTGIVGRKR